MIQSKEVIQDWIDLVNEEGRDLTKWELDFMKSITEFFKRTGFLSDKQIEILERIYTDKTP